MQRGNVSTNSKCIPWRVDEYARSGHAQADFGGAAVVIGGVEQKAHFFPMDLPHSSACFINPAFVSFLTQFQISPIPLRTDSITAAAMTDPIWPPVFAPIACMSR